MEISQDRAAARPVAQVRAAPRTALSPMKHALSIGMQVYFSGVVWPPRHTYRADTRGN
jgi:hypothetical protein